MQFWAEPNPEKCETYGPRIFVKLAGDEQYGPVDSPKTRVYQKLRKLCCWGGADKRYLSNNEENADTEILGFEFPMVVEQPLDSRMKPSARASVAKRRMAFAEAIKLLLDSGAEKIAPEQHEKFFAGFSN